MSWRASRTRPAALLVPAQRRDQQSGDKQSCKPDSTCSSACPRSAGHDAVLGAGRSQPACRLHSGVHLRRESVTSTLFAGSRWQRRRKRCAWLFPTTQESGRLSAHSRRLQSTSLFRRQQIWCKSTQTPSRCVESLQPATLPAAFLASSIARKTSIPKKILRSCTGISPSQRTTFVLFHSREPDNILRQCADRRGQHVHRSTSTVRCWQLNDLITLQSNAPAVDFTTSEPIALLASGGNDTCALLQSNRLGARAYVLRR